jgi:hypothetical protein
MAVVTKCRSEAKIGLSVKQLLSSETLDQLAGDIVPVTTDALPIDETEQSDTSFDLTAIQNMFVSRTASMDYSQSFLLKLTREVEVGNFQRAFNHLVKQNSMLRARFDVERLTGQVSQRVLPFDTEIYHLDIWDQASLDDAYRINSTTTSTLNMWKGPVFAVNIFQNVIGIGQVVFMTAHHMVIDLVSWRIIIADLEDYISREETCSSALLVSSPDPSRMSFQVWSRLQRELIPLTDFSKARDLEDSLPINLEYWGMSDVADSFGDIDASHFTLDKTTTSLLLGTCNAPLGSEPVDIFLGVMIHSFPEIFADRSVPSFYTEGHGREPWHQDLDVSRTVGWFTTMHPVLLSADRCRDLKECIAQVKDTRRGFPDHGFEWFNSRFRPSQATSTKSAGAVELIFNYFGLYQQLERKDALFAPLNVRQSQPTEEGGTSTIRMSLLEIDISVHEGMLTTSLLYNRKMKHQDRLCSWMRLARQLFLEAATLLPTMQRTLTANDVRILGIEYRGARRIVQAVSNDTGLVEADIERIDPCTSMQNDLLRSQARGLGYYDTRMIWNVRSKVGKNSSDLGDILVSGWNKVMSRHTTLRTVFVRKPDEPDIWMQVILKQPVTSVSVLDSDQSAVVDTFAEATADFAPDYNVPQPRHRVKLRRMREGIVCQLDISHALIDGAAIQALLNDWICCSNNIEARSTAQFGAYIEFLPTRDLSVDHHYWTRYVDRIRPSLTPISSPLAGAFSKRQSKTTKVVRTLTADVARCCERHRVSPASIFRAAWAIALSKYSASSEVAFGYLAHGRDIPLNNPFDIVGPMLVTLPFTLEVPPDSLASSILQRTHQDYLASLERQTVSWGEMRNADGSHPGKIFNTLFNYRQAVDLSSHQSDSAFIFENMLTLDPMEVRTLSATTNPFSCAILLMMVPSMQLWPRSNRILRKFVFH